MSRPEREPNPEPQLEVYGLERFEHGPGIVDFSPGEFLQLQATVHLEKAEGRHFRTAQESLRALCALRPKSYSVSLNSLERRGEDRYQYNIFCPESSPQIRAGFSIPPLEEHGISDQQRTTELLAISTESPRIAVFGVAAHSEQQKFWQVRRAFAIILDHTRPKQTVDVYYADFKPFYHSDGLRHAAIKHLQTTPDLL